MLVLLYNAAGLTATAAANRKSRFSQFAGSLKALQDSMIQQAKASDPAARWTLDKHERGVAGIVEEGEIWEKGCISITLIEDGELSEVRAKTISGRTGANIAAGARYSACALSFVLHGRSPLVPTLRGDARVFVVGDDEWYGGGLDLTPSYVEEDDCRHFHGALARLCAAHGEAGTYAAMKATCDEYFYIPCRGEHRGVGGIFFDDLTAEWAPELCEARPAASNCSCWPPWQHRYTRHLLTPPLPPCHQAMLGAALDTDGPYMPIVRKRLPLAYTEAQKQWQLLRRGRYIEFNLLYDRGVKFGLSPQSVERVLVSSPPLVAFRYNSSTPAAGTPEAATQEVLRKPRDWVAG
jgi:coproporphyrinogen III oxidase